MRLLDKHFGKTISCHKAVLEKGRVSRLTLLDRQFDCAVVIAHSLDLVVEQT